MLNYSEGVDGAIKRVCLHIATTTLRCKYVAEVLSVFNKCDDTLWARKQHQIYYRSSISLNYLIHNLQNVQIYVTEGDLS